MKNLYGRDWHIVLIFNLKLFKTIHSANDRWNKDIFYRKLNTIHFVDALWNVTSLQIKVLIECQSLIKKKEVERNCVSKCTFHYLKNNTLPTVNFSAFLKDIDWNNGKINENYHILVYPKTIINKKYYNMYRNNNNEPKKWEKKIKSISSIYLCEWIRVSKLQQKWNKINVN